MAQEPQVRRGSAPTNPFADRWRIWYATISDYLIAHPTAKYTEIATALQRSVGTITQIMNTDLFRDYHAQRRQEFQRTHDFVLSSKLNAVAEKGLDLMLDVMQKKGDAVPLAQLTAITSSALENLGYGPKAAPAVQITNSNTQQVLVPVSAGALAEAREALRRAEAKKLFAAPPVLQAEAEPVQIELEAVEADVSLPSEH